MGDVNGDGVLDVIVASTASVVYALCVIFINFCSINNLTLIRRGDNGRFLGNFPVKLAGPVLSQPLLFQMNPADAQLHVIVHDYTGHIYVIDSFDGCVERIDLGGSSYLFFIGFQEKLKKLCP